MAAGAMGSNATSLDRAARRYDSEASVGLSAPWAICQDQGINCHLEDWRSRYINDRNGELVFGTLIRTNRKSLIVRTVMMDPLEAKAPNLIDVPRATTRSAGGRLFWLPVFEPRRSPRMLKTKMPTLRQVFIRSSRIWCRTALVLKLPPASGSALQVIRLARRSQLLKGFSCAVSRPLSADEFGLARYC